MFFPGEGTENASILQSQIPGDVNLLVKERAGRPFRRRKLDEKKNAIIPSLSGCIYNHELSVIKNKIKNKKTELSVASVRPPSGARPRSDP
jgi:hypothetical protein